MLYVPGSGLLAGLAWRSDEVWAGPTHVVVDRAEKDHAWPTRRACSLHGPRRVKLRDFGGGERAGENREVI